MDVIGDLLERDRRSRDVAIVTADGRERTYHDAITNAYKATNVLRYLGAREGSTVAIDPAPGLHTALAFLGAARLGAPVRFDPDAGIEAGDCVVLVDVADEATTDPTPGTNLAAFGGPPERPETTHWEQELWSENPATPPSDVAPADPVLRGADPHRAEPAARDISHRDPTPRDISHRDLLAAASSVAERYEIEPGTRVVLRSDLADPRALAAGLLAPLSTGATAVLTDRNREPEAESTDTAVSVVAAGASAAAQRDVALDPIGVR
ncbi:hypothetical protein [Halorubrum trueperi]|uniref:Acetyl-CoA synthetase n=1 Tax=Halorubrum trueperi TaxID=2004704 RepID=A0ABD5UFT7_9EURY